MDSISLRIPLALNIYGSAEETCALGDGDFELTLYGMTDYLAELSWVQCIIDTYQNVQ